MNLSLQLAEVEKQVSILISENIEYKKQLTKAKEILLEYIGINLLQPIERNFDDEVRLFEKAEQFLKETEQ